MHTLNVFPPKTGSLALPEVRLPTHRDETVTMFRVGRRLKAKPLGYQNGEKTKESKTEHGEESVMENKGQPFKSQKCKNIYFTAHELKMLQFNQSSQHKYLVSVDYLCRPEPGRSTRMTNTNLTR